MRWAGECECSARFRTFRGVELVGLEPTTSAMPLQRSSKLSYSPTFSTESPNGREQLASFQRRRHLSQPISVRQAALLELSSD